MATCVEQGGGGEGMGEHEAKPRVTPAKAEWSLSAGGGAYSVSLSEEPSSSDLSSAESEECAEESAEEYSEE